jgi:hypothetical protein
MVLQNTRIYKGTILAVLPDMRSVMQELTLKRNNVLPPSVRHLRMVLGYVDDLIATFRKALQSLELDVNIMCSSKVL